MFNYVFGRIDNFVARLDTNIYNEKEKLKIEYGLKIVFIVLFDTVTMLLASYMLGILNYFIYGYISIALVRSFSGGIHLKSYYRCWLMSFITMCLTGYLGHMNMFKFYYYIIIFISYILISLYAPADTKYRPIISIREKILFRKILYSLIVGDLILIYIYNNIFSRTLAFSLLISSILITPISYKLFKVEKAKK